MTGLNSKYVIPVHPTTHDSITSELQKRPAILFCGHRSRFGLAHAGPVREAFDLKAVVVADAPRWRIFEERIGERAHSGPGLQVAIARARAAAQHWRCLNRLKRELGSARLIITHDANNREWIAQLDRRYSGATILCAAFPQVFRSDFLNTFPRAINFHPSLLPRYRGAHPHYWVLARGETESGITAHYIDSRIDAGDILVQTPFPISAYNYETLYRKIVHEVPPLVHRVAAFLDDPHSRPIKQDDECATTFRNDRDVHHRILWKTMTAVEIYNLIRTHTATCDFRGNTISIMEAHTSPIQRAPGSIGPEPGTIVNATTNAITVAAKDGCIEIDCLLDHRGRKISNKRRWPSVGETFG
ncbi:methionyl-tRNA formyltransferase [Bradyrhizobium sp. MOS002]|uniref:methionyl-tRNA formyltransferase n=1 Tax=Bradyrhizobium sp. MOS002 TaxID=2133947 RepID=UPI000D12190E|nr:formyltransferase family protein [Bradyrhizobium sp. MOS002]PSO25971.1 hypothetical protein C7G41_28745 [Bradyrhizobium sp. MOS002]